MIRAEDWLEKFRGIHALVVGDLMLDEYLCGHMERISPEAPVPILSVVGREATLGGAGNVVRNLSSLGVRVSVVGVTGEDETGEQILELLGALGTDRRGVVRDEKRKSTRKVRFVSLEHGQQVFRMDEETTDPVCKEVEEQIIGLIQEKASDVQVFLCSDYLKGALTERVLNAAFQAGNRRGTPVVVAPKDSNPQKYKGASVLMPNVRELSRLVGTPMDGLPWLVESVGRLTKCLQLQAMLVTRGKEGMSLFEELPGGLHRMDIPTVARNVYDVTGAGDTAIAAFAAGLGAGAGLRSAARLANAAAGVVVGKRGTATVTIEEILEHVEEKESEAQWTEEAPWRFRSASHQ